MTDIILASSSRSMNCSTPTTNNNDEFHHQQTCLNHEPLVISSSSSRSSSSSNPPVSLYGRNYTTRETLLQEVEEEEEDDRISVLAVLVTVLRNSLVGPCTNNTSAENCGVENNNNKVMEIGCPTNVRHVAHVTFDRFNGFLGLPLEFEPHVPTRPPSASTRVFGVSTESMQLSFDSRGNCVPTILLMMQRRLYLQGGLQSEGIFRINPENGQEEFVREQLNNGVIPDDIDVHCLAGLIKAWFRELPSGGILDTLPPEQIMEAQSEDECSGLVSQLPPTESALLDWAVNLMTDVAQLDSFNKMNPRNIAMVFAPNMTQMSDPLTALMHAVQVMNFLKTLIVKTLREREQDFLVEEGPKMESEPSNEDGRFSILKTNEVSGESQSGENSSSSNDSPQGEESRMGINDDGDRGFLSSIENILHGTTKSGEKMKEPSTISRVNSRVERVEVWR
ncbi:hypothetical protein ABFS82_12G151600 [Erythranthe guttata]